MQGLIQPYIEPNRNHFHVTKTPFHHLKGAILVYGCTIRPVNSQLLVALTRTPKR